MSSPGKNAALKIVRHVEKMNDLIEAQQDILLDLVNMVNDAGGVVEHESAAVGVLLGIEEGKLAVAYIEACVLLGKEPRINKRQELKQ